MRPKRLTADGKRLLAFSWALHATLFVFMVVSTVVARDRIGPEDTWLVVLIFTLTVLFAVFFHAVIHEFDATIQDQARARRRLEREGRRQLREEQELERELREQRDP